MIYLLRKKRFAVIILSASSQHSSVFCHSNPPPLPMLFQSITITCTSFSVKTCKREGEDICSGYSLPSSPAERVQINPWPINYAAGEYILIDFYSQHLSPITPSNESTATSSIQGYYCPPLNTSVSGRTQQSDLYRM